MCVCLEMFVILFFHSFYPLYPPFCQEPDVVSQDHTPYTSNTTEVNFDLRVAYESGHVSLPVLPDLLVLTSDLKPFTKVKTNESIIMYLCLFSYCL